MDLTPSVKRMVDLSTSHMTKEDTRLMPRAERRRMFDTGAGLPRILTHEYGWIVFVSSEFADDYAKAMKAFGFSDALVSIYKSAAALGGDVMLINFDSDGAEVEGLPRFDW